MASRSKILSCKHRSSFILRAAHSSSSWLRLSFSCVNTPVARTMMPLNLYFHVPLHATDSISCTVHGWTDCCTLLLQLAEIIFIQQEPINTANIPVWYTLHCAAYVTLPSKTSHIDTFHEILISHTCKEHSFSFQMIPKLCKSAYRFKSYW